ncbi:hypothetical protein FJZ23_02145 [Candidatus Parcubacteria bacterium]|nr:hypothetical protein [Candidatus Parcubacteria bacterium]
MVPPFLIAALVLFFVWLALFLFSNATRREQVIMSVVGFVLAPGILLIVADDYRQIVSERVASVGLEDLLFSFSLFGIAAVLYQALFGRHAHKLKGERLRHAHPAVHWYAHLLIVLGLWAFIALLLIHVFELASIRALIVGGLMIGIYAIADRRDLVLDALLSGLFTAILVFLTEQLFFARLFPDAAAGFWRFDEMSLFLVGGVPLEEILWAAVVGFTVGPLYEWLRRYELK